MYWVFIYYARYNIQHFIGIDHLFSYRESIVCITFKNEFMFY